jgi:hypothetical protein
MSTTNLFVELVIIGIGASIWLTFTLLCVFGYAWIPLDWSNPVAHLEKIITVPALIPTLAVAYVFGIVVDRIADLTFQGWDRKLRQKHFSQSVDYQRARTVIYDQSPSLRDWFQYGRSRLRICRGWTINSSLCIITTNAFIWMWLPADSPRLHLSLFGSVAFGILAVGALSAWYRLADGEYKRLWEEYSFTQDKPNRDNTFYTPVR